jgi:hypothetical protein
VKVMALSSDRTVVATTSGKCLEKPEAFNIKQLILQQKKENKNYGRY